MELEFRSSSTSSSSGGSVFQFWLAKESGCRRRADGLTLTTRRRGQRHLLKCPSPFGSPVGCWSVAVSVSLLLLSLANCWPSSSSSSLVRAASERRAISLQAPTATPTSSSSTTTTTSTTTTPRPPARSQTTKHYKLPSWFNYELYKQLYGKRRSRPEVDELHKRIYLRTALRVFEQRALYRANRLDALVSMNELSDLTSDELVAFRSRKAANGTRAKRPANAAPKLQLPDCCTYDQVYARIIELLDEASGSTEEGVAGPPEASSRTPDWPLSRALMEELEQKPLLESDEAYDQATERPAPRQESPRRPVMVVAATAGASSLLLPPPPPKAPTASTGTRAKRPQPSATLAHDALGGLDAVRGRGRARQSGRGANATTTSPSGPAKSKQAAAIEATSLAQLKEQLSADAPLGKMLTEALSAKFGQPVRVRASINGIREIPSDQS